MKRLVLFLTLAVRMHAASDVTLLAWQEWPDEKSGERQFGFFLAPVAVKKVVDADAKGNTKAAQALAAKRS